MKIQELDTPALLVDLDAMESNLDRMAAFFRDKRAKLRPHFKNHKVPLLAWKQLEAGAIGITCATLDEAEVLVNHGVRSILIANEIAGAHPIERLADLSRHGDLIAAVDDARVVADMARTSRRRGIPLSVLIDVDVGLKRCGVAPGEPVRALACAAAASGLCVRGVMGYEGHLQEIAPGEERDAQVREVARSLVVSRQMIEDAGIAGAEIVSTAGTGTYAVSGEVPGVTEIQAGSYLLMDTIYVERRAPFTRSLTVLATVVSRPEPGRAVLDCGVKAISGERGLPAVKDIEGVEVTALHAVHAPLALRPGVCLEVGQKVELWVRYSDGTVNLHSRMYGVRDGEVEEVFRIER